MKSHTARDGRVRLVAIHQILIAIIGALIFVAISTPTTSRADAEPIYTLPFFDDYEQPIECGFGCYQGHEGTDFVIGDAPGGEAIASAASGTAKPCPEDPNAGHYIVVDHGSGHRTRYLHLQSPALPYDGQYVLRGEVIGVEGSTGDSTGPHLHFETRIDATAFTCQKDGTAVDPYASSTYMWSTNPASYYRGTETVGIFRWSPLEWRLTDSHDDLPGTHHWIHPPSMYGQSGDKAVYGDWDGDGKGTIGVFRSFNPPKARWYLNDQLDGSSSEHQFTYGEFSVKPVAGDWAGTGSRPGVYRAEGIHGWWYINYDFDETTNKKFKYGLAADLPVSGDWDCDGIETVGVFRPSNNSWYLNNQLDETSSYFPPLEYGASGDIAVAGDWDGDGCDSVGVFRPSNNTWYLNNDIDDGNSEYFPSYGEPTDLPVVGDWNGQ
jgi:hypothetical protein